MKAACRCGTLVATLLLVSGCTSEAPSATSTTTATSPTSTTTLASTSITTATPLPTTSQPSVTVIVPTRPEGLAALGLSPVILSGIDILRPSVVALLPHDQTAVTEALEFSTQGQLLESVGLHGRSGRRILDIDNGDLLTQVRIRPEIYATGIATLNDGVSLQFSRLEELVSVFDPTTLALEEERSYPFEVSGACILQDEPAADPIVVVSHPDSKLSFISAETLELLRSIEPVAGTLRIPPLTDLHCDGDAVWGIVGNTGVVVKIDATTGELLALADLAALTPAGLGSKDVLSGLALRETSDTWFVTGKRWDVLYEVSFEP